MQPTPRLLETYEEARLLFEAKGWGLAKAAEHLSELSELDRFNISQTKLSKKTTPGSKVPIEPEVAAAVEGMQTWRGYERQTEIVTAGLLALHGDPSIVDVGQVAAEVRERLPASEPAIKLVEALEEKGGLWATRFFQTLAERLGRTSGKQIAISAGSGALVGCLALVTLAPLLVGATQPGPFLVIIADAGPDGAPVRFDPGAILATPAAWGEKPLDQPIPVKTLPGQKVAPCDAGLGEVAINGNCWGAMADVKPPCGRLFRQGDKCYRPIAAEPKKPAP
jgi:hypothetical protein